jgi:hypothetical protein
MEAIYTFMQTLGGDMVSFLNGGYHEVLSRVNELYPEQPDWEDQGQQPGGKSQYDTDDANGERQSDGDDDDDDDTVIRSSSSSSSSSKSGGGSMPGAASSARGQMASSARVASSAEGLELRRMVAGFAAQAHLATDLDPATRSELRQSSPGARTLDQLASASSSSSSSSSSSRSSGGSSFSGPQATVSAVTAALVAGAAFALGVAFQNQKAWADISTQRYSTAQYTALM